MSLVAATAGLVALPQLAAADDVQDQLRQMSERMKQLEDKLQATNDQLDQANDRVAEQSQVLEKSGLTDEGSAISSLSKFLEDTQFNGVVAASYNWNFNHPDNTPGFGTTRAGGTAGSGENQSVVGLGAPFHRYHNNFQLDQALISMSKPSTAESRAGFGVDVAWGVAADQQGGNSAGSGSVSSNDTYLYQAYASYLAALGDGVQVKAGKFATPIGAEAYRTDQNWNITNGLVWQIQPVTHTGVMLSGNLAGGLYWGAGVVNNVDNTVNAGLDTNNVKTGLLQAGLARDNFKVQLTSLIGPGDTGFLEGQGLNAHPTGNTDKGQLYYTDLLATWNPSDALALWLNFDWITQREDGFAGADENVYATAIAGRLAVTEKTGIATRFEYVKFAEVCRSGECPGGLGEANDSIDLFSLTGTVDHALTDNMTIRAELRWDLGDSDNSGDNFFIHNEAAARDDRVLALAQMLYRF
jgi:hypothetical protein